MHAIQHVLSTTNSEITVVFSDKHRDDEINYKMAKLIEGEIGYGAGIRRYVLVCGVVIPIKIQKSYNASPDMPKEAHSPHVERWLNGEISQTGEKIEYASVTESAFQLQPERLMPLPTGFASYPTGLNASAYGVCIVSNRTNASAYRVCIVSNRTNASARKCILELYC